MIYAYQEEAYAASKCQILRVVPHLRVGEEESHGDESTNDHGASSTPEEFASAHEACQNRRRNGACVSNGVVASVNVLGLLAKLCTASSQVGGQEDIVKRVSETDEQP